MFNALGARIIFCIFLGLVLRSAGVQAADTCMLEMATQYQSRLADRDQRVAQMAGSLAAGERKVIADLVKGDLKSWCTDASPARALTYWKALEKKLTPRLSEGRGEWTAAFAELSQACGSSPESFRNAAFAIDWMYWNRQADTLGVEVADALDIRDFFYEGWVSWYSRQLVSRQIGASQTQSGQSGEPCAAAADRDFLSAGPMREADFLRVLGVVLNVLDRGGRETVRAVAEELDLRDGSIVIYGQDLLELLESPKDLEFLNAVSQELEAWSGPRRSELGRLHGGWARLLELADGDQARVIRVLGVLASMRYWPLEEVGTALARRGQLTCEKLKALEQGAMAYFRLNALDERAALTPSDQKGVIYHYFYPPEYSTRDWKIYHWFGNGHLGCKLALRGADDRLVKYGARSLAQAYEFATLNLGGPSRKAMGLDPRVRPLLEGWEDIDINTEGAIYGGRACRAAAE